MTRALVVVEGAAETVGALRDGAAFVRFFFGPANGDEEAARPARPGEIVFGRVRTVLPAMKSAFVDIGETREAILAIAAGSKAPVVGSAFLFRIKRAAFGDKGAVVEATGDTPPKDARPGRAKTAPTARSLLEAEAGASGLAAPIEIADPETAAAIDAAIDASLERIEPLQGGGRLIIDETEGGAVIDVDAGEAARPGARPVNDRINAQAAAALYGALGRRRIGGRIVVDFLPPSSAEARAALVASLKAGAAFYPRRLGRLSVDGLLDMTAPRVADSLLGHATEPADERLVRPGRRLTLDFAARRAVRALERRLGARPSGRLRLIVGADLQRYLGRNGHWLDRVAARYGARFEVTVDVARQARTYDVAE